MSFKITECSRSRITQHITHSNSSNNAAYSNKHKKNTDVTRAAKWLAGVIGSKSISDITDYLFKWQDDLEKGCENFLVEQCGWNRTAAHWTVKTASFIFL